jgi:serine/threonine protein kinase
MIDLKLLQCRVDGRYDIEDCLGRGSYAEIYVARDRGATDEKFRKVVVKALNVLLQGYQDPELERTLVQNFQNEAIALDRVRHPNVISRLGHGTAIDLNGAAFHYLVLEYLGGGDLAALGRREPLGLRRSLFYLQQVCAGLAHAHASGVIHRDIKPQNLLMTADHEIVKIADFGVAKLEAGDGAITRVGTNIYAAPEHNPVIQTAQLDPAELVTHFQLTPAADIYSLAKTAYTLICGAPPRRFAQHAITDLPSPFANEHWALRVIEVLERATQTRAGDRYQTVQEFWEELSEATLPPTRPLAITAEGRRQPSLDLNVDVAVIPEAPPLPIFETSRDLHREQMSGNGSARPRIVVPVGRAAPTQLDHHFVPEPQPGRVTVSVPRKEAPPVRAAIPASHNPPTKRGRSFMVGVILVLTFAGLLLATGAYVRARWNRQQAAQQQQQNNQTVVVGREGVTTTDLNLRSDPSTANDSIGLAESGSRVRVLSVASNWCEVQVLQHARPKKDASSSDRGWVNKRFLKFD